MSDFSLIGYAFRTAKCFYHPNTYQHAIRVANYVADSNLIPEEKRDFCIALALMHDLLEDTMFETTYLVENCQHHFVECLNLLTKDRRSAYENYIKNIRFNANQCPEAYWVKMADMKDHLAQKDTLTDKLKEKYLNALPLFL